MNPVPKPKMVAKAPKQRLPRVNVKRAAIRKARDFGSVAEWIRTLPCCVCGKRTGEITNIGTRALLGVPSVTQVHVDAAHVRSRGAGGRKHANLIPLSYHLHEKQHTQGWGSIGLTKERAQQLAKEYQALWETLFVVGLAQEGSEAK